MKLKLAFLLPLFALLFPAILPARDGHDQNSKGSRHAGRAPILLVEINNNGDVRLTLTVYNDGEAILARKDGDEPDGEICTASVSAADLESVQRTLRRAGALYLQDASALPNTSRKTISFFIGPNNHSQTFGNTFSYSAAQGPYLTVAQAISELIENNFGGCI